MTTTKKPSDDILGFSDEDSTCNFRYRVVEKVSSIFECPLFNWASGMSVPGFEIPAGTVYARGEVIGVFFRDQSPMLIFKIFLIKEEGGTFIGWK